MAHIVQNTHKFNNGVLTVDFFMIAPYNDGSLTVADVEFEEFDLDSGKYVSLEEECVEKIDVQDASRYVVTLYENNTNHLLKAIVWIDPETIGDSGPCCVNVEEKNGKRYWVYEAYFVDMFAYEKSILESINLGCADNCDVPMDLINKLLRLFAVQAAVDSRDPKMEKIFSKIACGKTVNVSHSTLSRKCNCNG